MKTLGCSASIYSERILALHDDHRNMKLSDRSIMRLAQHQGCIEAQGIHNG
jgi:hypothetical protein